MKIFIIKYNTQVSSQEKYKYEARNINQFDQSIEIPTQVFGLPEYPTDSAILTKAEGNTERITFTWTIKDETYSPVTDVSGNYVDSFIRTNDNTSWDPRTPEGAVVFLQEEYEKIGISTNEKYEFRIYDDDNSKNLLRKFGIPSRLGFSKGAQDPATWNATMEFTVGEDVTID
tara:strand:- start:83 stop:601 length:519 start_codon:yes stop_codon:yes gene_type:complete